MKSKAICILGMHRSGTSVITRAVNLLGAYIGEESELIPPNEGNPEGYWERDDINSLQDRILAHYRKSWDTAIPLPENWHRSDEMLPFKQELIEILNKSFSDQRLWAWKDPRTGILLDMWKDILEELGIELSCVFVIRNPVDVAKSLLKRNGFPLDKSFGIWFNYNITALRKISLIPTAYVSYNSFLRSWESELKRCTVRLGVSWPEDDSELKAKIKSFLRPNLCHGTSKNSELKEPLVPLPVIKLYKLLAEAERLSPVSDTTFSKEVELLFKNYWEYAKFFQYDISNIWHEQHVVGKNIQIEQQKLIIEGQKQCIQTLLNSWSWKITSPLRWLYIKFMR